MVVLLAALVILYSFQSLFLRLYTASRGCEGEMQFSVVYGVFAGICTLAINGFVYAPSWITLLLGVFVYKEPVDRVQVLAFAIIWVGLIFFSYGEFKGGKEPDK